MFTYVCIFIFLIKANHIYLYIYQSRGKQNKTTHWSFSPRRPLHFRGFAC